MERNSHVQLGAGRKNRALLALLVLIGLGTAATKARAVDGPKIDKTSLILNTWQVWQTWVPGQNKYKPDYTSWMPFMKFRVHGPLPDGSQLSVEYTRPDGSVWVTIPCPTDEIKGNESRIVETPRSTSTDFEKKYTGDVGVYGYKIKLKNELAGTNSILLSGTFLVGKVSKYNGTPITKNKYDYFVNYDWALPIGLVWLHEVNGRANVLHCGFWFKNSTSAADLAGYVIYNGAEIGSTKKMGNASHTEQDIQTAGDDKGDPRWTMRDFQWYLIGRPAADEPNKDIFDISKHPGVYTIKILQSGSLCRQANFTVGADGHIKHEITDENDLGSNRVIVPVAIHGTADGAWRMQAYKTEAFFGHPLKGFVWP